VPKSYLLRTFIYSFYACVIVLWLAFALEIIFRFMPVYNPEWMDYDSYTVWRVKSDHKGPKWSEQYPQFFQVFNHEGFNDRNHEVKKKPGVKRIMVLGDSFTGCFDYKPEDVFTGILEKNLNDKYPGEYEVMNCATPAWATEQEYSYFIHEGAKYQPDYVVLTIAPNDIRETFTRHMLDIRGDSVQPWIVNPMSRAEKLAWKLCTRSSVAQWMRKNKMLPNATFEEILNKYFGSPYSDFSKGYGWEEPMFFNETPVQVQQANNRMRILIAALQRRCREIDATLMVNVMPTIDEFNHSLSDTSKYQPGRVSFWLDTTCSRMNIPFCQMYTAFAQSPEPLSFYQPEGAHFNLQGNKWMGEELTRFFEKQIAQAK
jgi:hypothetical protein